MKALLKMLIQYGIRQSTLSTGGSGVLSTPNGVGNYHKTWVGAMEGTNEFNPIKLHWDLHPRKKSRLER